MKLYCMRHGEAENVPSQGAERSLTEKGQMDVLKLGIALKEKQFQFTQVIHSDKLRAAQTAQLFLKGLHAECHFQSTDLLRPDANIQSMLSMIQVWETDTLLVGHLPFISDLVSALVVQDPMRPLIHFHPATLVCLERMQLHQWVIRWVVNPELFPS